MPVLDIKAKSQCKYDIVALGEIMIRLDPGDDRIHTTRSFRVWEGGGEYNVARGLKRCFGAEAAVVTAIADNPVNELSIVPGAEHVQSYHTRPNEYISRVSSFFGRELK